GTLNSRDARLIETAFAFRLSALQEKTPGPKRLASTPVGADKFGSGPVELGNQAAGAEAQERSPNRSDKSGRRHGSTSSKLPDSSGRRPDLKRNPHLRAFRQPCRTQPAEETLYTKAELRRSVRSTAPGREAGFSVFSAIPAGFRMASPSPRPSSARRPRHRQARQEGSRPAAPCGRWPSAPWRQPCRRNARRLTSSRGRRTRARERRLPTCADGAATSRCSKGGRSKRYPRAA